MSYEQLWIWTGPVSAAKTEGALRIITRLLRQRNRLGNKNSVVLIRPKTSMRNEEIDSKIKTKDGREFPCKEVDSVHDIFTILNSNNDHDILWLDEIHFWPDESELFEIVQQIRKHKMVIISGISATNNMSPLGLSMGRLLQVADRIFSERADCDFCGGLDVATRTVHIGAQKKTTDVLLGGEESFRPACYICWNGLKDLTPAQIRRSIVADY